MVGQSAPEFLTIEKSDLNFEKYLLGSFSDDHRALPVQSLNVNRENEKVTFQIVHNSKIQKPKTYRILLQLFRVDALTLTLAPALAVLATHAKNIENTRNVFFALASLLFLHFAVFCRNDFVDHMRGVDRTNEKGGSRVIQKGWLKAVTVQKLYRVCLAISISFALPVILQRPELILLSLAVAVFGVLGYSFLRWGKVHWVFGSLAVLLCLGPLLTTGMSWVIHAQVTVLSLLMGFYFGLLAMIYVYLRHMMNIIVDDEAGVKTLPVVVGFDRAKMGVIFLFIVSAFLFEAIATTMHPSVVSLLALPMVGWIFWQAKRSFQLKSPVSSRLYVLPKSVMRMHMASAIMIFILDQLL
jgi:1,4-dihydroxy-2-naphthoate polyprenyltransferase